MATTFKKQLTNKSFKSNKLEEVSFSSNSSSMSSVRNSKGSTMSRNKKTNKIFDRSQLMDNMLFPENCNSLVIIPSNKEGTGFLNHCYDERFLKNYI